MYDWYVFFIYFSSYSFTHIPFTTRNVSINSLEIEIITFFFSTNVDVKSCRYHAIERDISIVSVTKSVRGTSTFHCEQACDYEKEFNCRSYTYLDNPDGSVAPGGNLCLLSADNRATSHQGSMQFRPRALYAEKDCAYQKWHKSLTQMGTSNSAAAAGPPLQLPPHIPSSMQAGQSRVYAPSTSADDGQASGKPPLPSHLSDHSTDHQQPQQQLAINPRNMGETNARHGDFYQTTSLSSSHDSFQQASNYSSIAYERSERPLQSSSGSDDISQLQHIPARCAPEEVFV